MVYSSLDLVKKLKGITTDKNDDKVQAAQMRATSYINGKLTNIEPIIPLPGPPYDPFIVDFETVLAAAYFDEFESGDNAIVEELKKSFEDDYMRNKYKRPRMITRTSFGGSRCC